MHMLHNCFGCVVDTIPYHLLQYEPLSPTLELHGPVVGVLASYSDDLSSNTTEFVLQIFRKIWFEWKFTKTGGVGSNVNKVNSWKGFPNHNSVHEKLGHFNTWINNNTSYIGPAYCWFRIPTIPTYLRAFLISLELWKVGQLRRYFSEILVRQDKQVVFEVIELDFYSDYMSFKFHY